MKESGSNHRSAGFLHLQSSSFSVPFQRGTCSLQGNSAVGLLLCLLCQKRKKIPTKYPYSGEKEIPNTEELVAVVAPLPIERQSSAELRNEI